MSHPVQRLRGFGAQTWIWMTYDFANSAFATSLMSVIFNQYYAGVIAGGTRGTDFNLWGYHFNLPGATLFELSVLFGTILTILLSPLVGIYADQRQAKKKLLSLTILVGVAASLGLSVLNPGDVLIGGVVYGIALGAFFLSLNLYNAFLPQICSPKDLGLVSGISWAIGYIGGGLCLLLNLVMLQSPELLGFAPGTLTVAHVIISVALWWLLFSLVVILGLKEPPISSTNLAPALPLKSFLKHLRLTFINVRRLPQLWTFLLAYLFFTNGIETTINSASIYGDQELGMDTAALIKLFLVVQFTAFPGALLFGLFVDWFGNKLSLVVSLIIWTVALVWVYHLGVWFDPITEFHLAAVLVGLVLGGSQAAARSLFASFTPASRSGEYFSFFGIAGRLAATVGPLTFALINTATHSLRQTIVSLVIFFLLGLIILLRVNERQGIQAAREADSASREA